MKKIFSLMLMLIFLVLPCLSIAEAGMDDAALNLLLKTAQQIGMSKQQNQQKAI